MGNNTTKKGTLYLVMDVSGSVDTEKREVYKRVYKKYKKEYSNVSLIEFTTTGKVINNFEELRPEAGGTYISSGLNIAVGQLVMKEDDGKEDLVVLLTDGDNWSEDNERTFKAVDFILSKCKMEIIEIFASTYSTPISDRIRKTMLDDSSNLKNVENLKITKINSKEDSYSFITIEEAMEIIEGLTAKNEKLHKKLKKVYDILDR